MFRLTGLVYRLTIIWFHDIFRCCLSYRQENQLVEQLLLILLLLLIMLIG
jgi:hypothetical protein